MFGSKPTCPVRPLVRAWIDRRWQWLTEEFGSERLRSAPLVLPTPEFFPDPYSESEADVQTMLDRVCDYMDLDSETIELSIYEEGRSPYAEGMHHGAAGLYTEEDGKFQIAIEATNIHEPQRLIATIAHELGHVHLLGHGRIDPDTEDNEPLTDLLTVFFGMGIFTANSVIREKYWDAGAVSGWQIGRQGYLTMPMYGYALAKFALDRSEDQPTWSKHLRLDVRSPFTKSIRFLLAPPADSSDLADEGEAPADEATEDESPAAESPGNAVSEEQTEQPQAPMDVEQLLKRRAAGEQDFRRVDLPGACLREADLSQCNFEGADLSECDLTSANLDGCNLRGTYLHDAHLRGATLRNANMIEADLHNADLSGADLTNADIRGADFRESSLDGAILVGTLRNRKTNLDGADLTNVKCDVDLAKERLQGESFNDQMLTLQQSIARRVIMLVFVGFVALFGGFLGALIGLAIGNHDGMQIGALIGAIIFGALFLRRVVRLRAKANAKDQTRG